MKAMLIGATGLLGKALTRAWKGGELLGLGSRDLDIRDARMWMDVRVTATWLWRLTARGQ